MVLKVYDIKKEPIKCFALYWLFLFDLLGKADEGQGMAGVDDGEEPPVPIPNTEVKLTCAEDSWLETACENR